MILSRFEVVSYIIRRMEANGTYTFTMLFEPAEEGGYVVTCPALPGLVTEGDTLEEVRQMAEDALRVYLETFKRTDDQFQHSGTGSINRSTTSCPSFPFWVSRNGRVF